MPLKFDLQQYQANWDPLGGGTFVSVQDVLNATSQMWVEVLTEMIKIIPTTAEQLVPIIAEGIPLLIEAILPTDGTASPLITGFITAIPQLGEQIPQLATAMAPAMMEAMIAGASVLPGLPLTLIQGLEPLMAGFDLTGAIPILGQLISAGGGSGSTLLDFANLFLGLESLPVQLIDSLVTVVSGFTTVGGALTDVGVLWRQPLTLLFSIPESVENIYQELLGKISNLQGQVTAIAQTTTPNTPSSGVPTAGTDDCSSASTFTNVLGTLVSSGIFIRTSGSTAAGYHNDGPQTDSHGTHCKVGQKLPGVTRQIICADTGLTNYLALEHRCDGLGNDCARIVVGFGPNAVMAQTQPDGSPAQWNGHIANDWVFTIEYDAPTNTFIGYINGVAYPEITWVDSSNQVTHGTTKREVGWCTNATGAFTPSDGLALLRFNYYDKVPA